jgi:hypothetical protein
MKRVFQIALIAFFLMHDFKLFAQGGPGDDDDNEDLEGDDLPAAPINTKLIYLGIIGIMFAFYLFNKKRKQII